METHHGPPHWSPLVWALVAKARDVLRERGFTDAQIDAELNRTRRKECDV
jgi:hypothetical protein